MSKTHRIVGICIPLVVLVLGVVYFVFDPSTSALFPKCPFRMLTGLPCPGCGSQRAFHCLLHLDLAAAFSYNAAAVLLLPVMFLCLAAHLLKEKAPGLHRFATSSKLGYTVFAFVLVWWALRLIFGWYV